ncbi:hypothetical protein K4K54_010298 [Colletotrichum sp. SAR 10_86]|nr:hypothetical protein K4K51_012463 [Colletotrichum sp. SAR 10_75]KAI8213350.1 hypothetical protein K4K52_005275 [Colletotrichum sp. SAR 10_76]KAI8233523.1 hypothetical protein K4K54_010298 [Colletotrichum sp. SAR 10_86]KAJ5005190.1 hypothetical protein K4K48_007842 [Colletotrichum sp. SAR 10_66]
MVGHLGASPDLLRRRVFIASSLATPHGLWVTKVLNPNRPAASYSFFVQAFGGRNAVPCNCCEARAYSLRDDSTGAWVCEPYFECVSMPGEPCANCIYHEDTLKECSYGDEEICKEFGYGMGKGRKRRKSGEYTGVGVARSRIDQRTTKRRRAQVLDFTKDIASVAERQIREYGATPESFMFINHLFMVEPPLDLDYDKIEELPSRVRGKAS